MVIPKSLSASGRSISARTANGFVYERVSGPRLPLWSPVVFGPLDFDHIARCAAFPAAMLRVQLAAAGARRYVLAARAVLWNSAPKG